MPGLIETPDLTKQIKNPFGTGPITESKAFGYDAAVGKVDETTDTVSAQLDRILKTGGPTMDRAGQRGAQAANARGLINSSMGVQAGQAAMIDAALPIASQDASTFSAQRLTNQAADNAARQFTAGSAGEASRFNAAAVNQPGLIQSQGEEARKTQAQAIAGQKELQTMQSGTQITLADKNAALQKELQTVQSNTQLTLQERTAQTQKVLAEMDTNSRRELQRIQSDTTMSVADKQAATARYTAELDASNRLALQSYDNAFKSAYQAADTEAKVRLQQADATTKLALSNIEADYKTLMQASQTAGDLYKTALATITNTMADPNMDAASKQATMDNQITILKSGLNLVGSVNGIDLSALLPA